MKTTCFRPSIHGWPFGNSFSYSVLFDTITLKDVGFCGGMCWTALCHYYDATPIARGLASPVAGDPTYQEIRSAQERSLPAGTLWKIYRWQQSPDLSHRFRKHSLGHMTQQQWPAVRQRLDQAEPLTLTLVTRSNDYNVAHLTDNHRVVAYGYEERTLFAGESAPAGADKIVTVQVYDPNCPNEDDVQMSFFLGGDDSNIRLRHNRGKEVHGFFVDDEDRQYAFADPTAVHIEQCRQIAIASATLADYELQFAWTCRVIPGFVLRIDGQNWNYNKGAGQARSDYPPTDRDLKQAPAHNGRLVLRLHLPRALSRVEVRLFDDDGSSAVIEVDTRPAVVCLPYVHDRAANDHPQINDGAITAADLFIGDANPTSAAVALLDTSPFRWIMLSPKRMVVDNRAQNSDLTRAVIETVDQYRLGNVQVPVMANFELKNLAAPVQLSLRVQVKRAGQAVQSSNPSPVAVQGQRIFDGFTGNPGDFDNDSSVLADYTASDKFGVIARGQLTLYGKSIIYQRTTIRIETFDPAKLAKYEMVAMQFLEQGLIDLAVTNPHAVQPGGVVPPGGMPPRPVDSMVLLRKLRNDAQLQQGIRQATRKLWQDATFWQDVWKLQSDLVKQAGGAATAAEVRFQKAAGLAPSLARANESELGRFEAAMLDAFSHQAITSLHADQSFLTRLRQMI